MSDAFKFSEAAHRFADIHNLHIFADRTNIGHWIAIRLADGGSDGVVYDHRREAVSHQFHESLCAYVKVHPAGMSAEEAESVLRFYRFAYDNGHRVIDPEGPELFMPLTVEDYTSQIRRLKGVK
jgi:hypothetical protein